MKPVQDLRVAWKFVRGHPTILFSMALVVIVPLILVLNTWWTIRLFQRVLDTQIQRQAMLVHDTLSLAIRGNLHDTANLTSYVLDIEETIGENVADYTLLQPDEGERTFVPVAGFSKERRVDEVFSSTQYAIAWAQDQAIATVVKDSLTGGRLLIVTKPIIDTNGDRWGLANVSLSLAPHDQLVQQAVNRSNAVMAVGVVIVLLLIANHVRMFEYAVRVQRLQEAEQLKDDFISVASHELRTPITGIQSFLSMVDEGSFGVLNEEGRSYIKQAMTSTTQLTNLVEDMLDVSRIEQGKMAFNPRIIDPGESIQRVMDELQYKAKEKGLSLELKQEINDISMRVDPHHFRRILVNLIGNAVKYTSKGTVTVYVRAADKKRVSIHIRDTGIGIPPDKIETLFKKFSRVHSEDSAKVQGTGLGLWITKALVENMGGRIYVSSIQGQGSEFTVMFDRIEKQPVAAQKT